MLITLHILLLLTLIAIVVIDLRQQIIPDALNMVVLGLGIGALAAQPAAPLTDALIGALALGGLGALLAGPYSRWRGRDMLGWGDVKFMVAAGVWLPLASIGWFLALAGTLGMLFALLRQRGSTNLWQAELPFAPALCISLAVMVLLRWL